MTFDKVCTQWLVLRYYQQGEKISEIAKYSGYSKSTIYRWLKKLGAR